MEFPNLHEDMSSIVEETHGGLGRFCRYKRQNYDDVNDNENDPDLNKETIIDAINYIKELKISVENLTREIYAMEGEMANEQSFEIIQIRPEEKNEEMRGIELVDISVTTTKGVVLVTSRIVGINGRVLVATQVQGVIADIIKAI
nr:RNA-directed DNA polymerase, eukaryota [Tanacetum cinerariifolium]